MDEPQDGALNMAIDEALGLSCAGGTGPPTLRLYQWKRPTLSLGYFQRVDKTVNEAACQQLGVELVRRLTGGRAVLHHRELTYSLSMPESHHLGQGGVTATYRAISQALLKGLQTLGVEARLVHQGGQAGGGSAACFDASSWYELVVNGRKLVGSAQARRGGFILQHGSLPLASDHFLSAQVLAMDIKHAERLAAILACRSTSLAEVLGRQPSFTEVGEALSHGFAAHFGTVLLPGALSRKEMADARGLAGDKYAGRNWNYAPGQSK